MEEGEGKAANLVIVLILNNPSPPPKKKPQKSIFVRQICCDCDSKPVVYKCPSLLLCFLLVIYVDKLSEKASYASVAGLPPGTNPSRAPNVINLN